VIGESTYIEGEVVAEHSESLYWRYETAIKKLETQTGSVVGGDGAIYAIRAALYEPMRADALSDFVNPLQIVKRGYRCIYEPEARSYERAASDFYKEFRRKVRIVNRAWRAMMTMPELLNPFRYGAFAMRLLSHKLLRWVMPAFLVALFIVHAVLAIDSARFAALFVAHLGLYILAAIGFLLRRRDHLPSLLSVPFYFCLVNAASACGIIDALRGKTYTTWTTARAPGR
jgi:hypothetical protein